MATAKNAIPVKLERKLKNLLNLHVAYGIWTMSFWAIKMSTTVRYIRRKIIMATVKKCDRCGKYYDKNTEDKQNINGRLYYEDGMCFTTVAEIDADFKDLCDECLDKLHIFLNGAELILEDVKND